MKTSELISNVKSYLCPPGDGVFTVNTAKERKEKLNQRLFGQPQDIRPLWEKSLEKLDEYQGCVITGVCSDTGGGIQRGANWGPLFVREQILEDFSQTKFFDIGDIRVIPHLLHDKYLNEKTIEGCKEALYQDTKVKHTVSPLSITKEFCDDFYSAKDNCGLFAIGGDHSVSYPLVKSWLEHKNKAGKKVGIIHFDAHTDLLHTRLGIDLCFGSWLTHVLGDLSDSKNCYQFGIRSSGKDKAHWEKEFGINQYWANEIKDIGPLDLAKKVTSELLERDVEEVYVSFDIDAIDSSIASATGTPEPDGLQPHECMIILKELNHHFKISGADMVEVAPLVGNDKMGQIKTLQTAAAISSFLIEAINNAHH
jgi:agmatinase